MNRRNAVASVLLAALLAFAGDGNHTRVRVIAPSTPEVDEYAPAVMEAVTETGEIDTGFTGEAWLWTDKPWLRPFHVKFWPVEKGVIHLVLQFDLPILQRVEAYEPGNSRIHTWSNPVIPVMPGRTPILLWGKMSDCSEPLLDYCITAGGKAGAVESQVIQIASIERDYKGEKFFIIPDPELAGKTLTRLTGGIADARDFPGFLQKQSDSIVIIRAGDEDGRLQKFEDMPPSLYLIRDWSGEISSLADTAAMGGALIAGGDGLIGAWTDGRSAKDIWNALKSNRAYAAHRCRNIIKWDNPEKLLLAGEGPMEKVELYSARERGLENIRTITTDDYHMNVSIAEINPSGAGRLLLLMTEPGNPKNPLTIALISRTF